MLLTTRSARPSPLTSPTARDEGVKSWPLAAKTRGGANVPLPWPSRTLTVSLSCFAATTSSRPSSLKSPTATARGTPPTATSTRDRKEPSPLPSSRLRVPWLFAVTRSRAPLRSKSPTAKEKGVWPTLRTSWFGWNEPSPLPSRTSTAGPAGPAVFRATSSRWSPLKSPTAADPAMPVPGPLFWTLVVTAGWNEPLPSPSSTLRLLWEVESCPVLTTARSDLPSLLKSATVTARGFTPTGNVTGGRKLRTVRSSSASSVNVRRRADRDSGRDFFRKVCNLDSAMRRTLRERKDRDERPHGGGAGTRGSGGRCRPVGRPTFRRRAKALNGSRRASPIDPRGVSLEPPSSVAVKSDWRVALSHARGR